MVLRAALWGGSAASRAVLRTTPSLRRWVKVYVSWVHRGCGAGVVEAIAAASAVCWVARGVRPGCCGGAAAASAAAAAVLWAVRGAGPYYGDNAADDVAAAAAVFLVL